MSLNSFMKWFKCAFTEQLIHNIHSAILQAVDDFELLLF